MLAFAKEAVSSSAKYYINGESGIEYSFWKAAAFRGWKLLQIPLTISKMQGPRKPIEITVMFPGVLSFLSLKNRILAAT